MTLVQELAAVVGDAHVLTDPAVTAAHVRDWTGRWAGECAAVVRPADEAEVAEVLRVASRAGARVVLQGGNTGLVAATVPEAGDVLLQLGRLDRVEAVDPVSSTVVAQAGVTLGSLQAALRPYGLELPVDLAARDTATLGGMAATNAGGIRVLSAGPMRTQVVAVDALDVEGRPLTRLRPLVKDNTGYALSSLLVGSEGTLGVITRLLLRVVPVEASRAVALVGLADVAAAVALVGRVRPQLPRLRAAELVDASCLDLVVRHAGLPRPLPGTAGALLLLEVAGQLEDLAAALEDVEDVAVADDPGGVRALWAYRERVTESLSAEGVPHKLDVSLPAAVTAGVVAACHDVVATRPGCTLHVFGHVGDGNLHLNVLGADPDDEDLDDVLLGLVLEAGGSVSAEHGIGRAKARWLTRQRGPEELAAMAAVKRALDPDGRLGRSFEPTPPVTRRPR